MQVDCEVNAMNGVEAKYLGYDDRIQKYRVNVRTANPTGKIGDAGVIRYFETKNDAKDYTNIVNKTKQDVFTPEVKKTKEDIPVRHAGDVFAMSFKSNENENLKVNPCPKISLWRGVFSRLTDEQIKAVNETKKLPEGTKFQFNRICHNWFNIMPGTRDLPVGYELKKDVFGFTTVVQKGTEGMFIRDVK